MTSYKLVTASKSNYKNCYSPRLQSGKLSKGKLPIEFGDISQETLFSEERCDPQIETIENALIKSKDS